MKPLQNKPIEKIVTDGLKMHQAGNLVEAKKLYQDALIIEPKNFSALQLMGLVLVQSGENLRSINYFDQALQLNPKFVPCYINRGIAFHTLGRFDDAINSYKQAIKIQPNSVEAYSNIGITLNSLKRYDEALISYEKALSIKPNFADAYSNQGNTLEEIGAIEKAILSYKKAIDINGKCVDAYLNLGNLLFKLKKYDAAIENYELAININSNNAQLYYSLGNAYQALKKLGTAISCYEKCISINKNYCDAYLNRGAIYHIFKQYDAALLSYDSAIALQPNYVKAYSNRGVVLKDLKKYVDALQNYDKSISIDPNYAKAHSNRGLLLAELKRYQEAQASYERVIELEQNNAQAYYDLGTVLHDQGRFEEAIKQYKIALKIDPTHKVARDNILFIESYTAIVAPKEFLIEARNWQLSKYTPEELKHSSTRIFKRQNLKGRRLRVGYISGDFYNHAVSYFTDALFKYRDQSRIEVFAYSTNSFADDYTETLKSLVDSWVPIHNLSDIEARNRIENDELDLLVDLSGYTAHNRMEVFAMRAAPIQAHYLGFTGSTGLFEMDYWIGDHTLTPPSIQDYFSEKLVRLPRVWVSYKGDQNVPLSAWKPPTDGSICLGSFNDLAKFTDTTYELWAKILHALPEAYLLIKTKKLGDITNRKKVLDKFRSLGISEDQIELRDYSDTPNWHEHMTYYDRVDIALDPYGAAGGGTTTCDALWMGVPIITMVKDDSPASSRMTASMLNSISRQDWVASNDSEYVEKTILLAKNIDKRKLLRLNQRELLMKSPLCNPKDLAKSLEDAYVSMFNNWYKEKC